MSFCNHVKMQGIKHEVAQLIAQPMLDMGVHPCTAPLYLHPNAHCTGMQLPCTPCPSFHRYS